MSEINELQNLEQSINNIIAQKQQFQSQKIEIDNALSQVDKTDKVFQILGNIMVSSKKADVKEELDEKKEIIELRLKTLEKQEDKLRNRAAKLQKEVLKKMKSGKNG